MSSLVHSGQEAVVPTAQAEKPASHTPGPWEHVGATERHGHYVVTDFGSTVCDLYVMSKPVPWATDPSPKPVSFMHEMAEANARLIAAAPDLFAAAVATIEARDACEIMTDAQWNAPETEARALACFNALRAAIAKAADEVSA